MGGAEEMELPKGGSEQQERGPRPCRFPIIPG